MRALKFDGQLTCVQDAPILKRAGEALIEVLCAGICNTDLEIVKGYSGFQGILGHEFVGKVVESPDHELLGQRVVGEINVGCGVCEVCKANDARHCPNRTVLGIKARDGAFAEFLSLPMGNLIPVPDWLSNEEAVFIEPFAAACQILEQVEINQSTDVVVLGDGKLAQLIVRAIALTGSRATVVGKHRSKMALMQTTVSSFYRLEEGKDPTAEILRQNSGARFDVVIEATGSEKGLPIAASLVKPRGTIVLKSTHHRTTSFDMSQIVVNEINIIGSRCGRFHRAIEALTKERIDLQPLISAKFNLDEGVTAFAKATEPNTLKVMIDMQKDN